MRLAHVVASLHGISRDIKPDNHLGTWARLDLRCPRALESTGLADHNVVYDHSALGSPWCANAYNSLKRTETRLICAALEHGNLYKSTPIQSIKKRLS